MYLLLGKTIDVNWQASTLNLTSNERLQYILYGGIRFVFICYQRLSKDFNLQVKNVVYLFFALDRSIMYLYL